MDHPAADPDPLIALAARVAARLGEVEGVAAVVLGGSVARGVADTGSDIDLGIYYHPSHPLDIDGLRRLATELDDRHAGDAVTEPGAWGPWVNGGAWLTIGGQRIDWIYRDIERVSDVIADCRAGVITADYYLGHPHAFHSHIYAGEIATCRPLFDPGHVVTALKILVWPYPELLRDAIITRYLFDARFMLDVSAKTAARGDVFQVVGCFFRVAAALVQVMLALNGEYFVNEQRALKLADEAPIRPARFAPTIRRVLGRAGTTPEQLGGSWAALDRLVAESVALAGRFTGYPGLGSLPGGGSGAATSVEGAAGSARPARRSR